MRDGERSARETAAQSVPDDLSLQFTRPLGWISKPT
jgi:hypothetical protein